MKKPENITLRIEHVDDYKVLFIECENNHSAYDVNISVVMLQNFFDNCKQNNIKFAWVFDTSKIKYSSSFYIGSCI